MKTNELIERLRNIVPHCWSKIRKKLDDIADEISDTLETQQKRIAELEAERNAAVETIRKILSEEYGTICEFCAHDKNKDALCAKPANGSGGWCCQNARWRGASGREEGA